MRKPSPATDSYAILYALVKSEPDSTDKPHDIIGLTSHDPLVGK